METRSMFRVVLATLTILLASYAIAQAQQRVALVIGNSAYQHAPVLKNPSNDAAAMTAKLSGLGFETFGGENLNRTQLVEQLIRFGRAAEHADVALVFYAGHGLQVNGQNYLVPVDAAVEYEAEVDISLVSLSGVMSQLERGSRTNIVLLDACRNNPFKSLAGSARSAAPLQGLGRVQTGSGTYIAFATQPDAVASDGSAANSPFTTALLRHMGEPGESISDMMIEVRNDVMAETGGAQVPWDSSSLTGRFAFNDAGREAQPQAGEQSNANLEKDAYEQAVEVGSCGAYEAYQRRFPGSFFTDLAKERAAKACAAPVVEKKIAALQANPARAGTAVGVCEKGPFEVTYCASSVLKAIKNNYYTPGMMFDGRRETAWVEGDAGDGIDEAVTLRFATERPVSGFEIINGYDKDQKTWAANSRVKTLEATTSDGRTVMVELQDVRGSSRFTFDPPVSTSWLELRIKSVYAGTKYKDTAIAELYPLFAE